MASMTFCFALHVSPCIQGRPRQMRGAMQDLGAGLSEQWCYDVIVLRQPCYNLFDEDVKAKLLNEYKKDSKLLELICTQDRAYERNFTC